MIYKYKNIKVHYRVLGKQNLNKNIPILFLHGWGGSTKSFEYFAKKLSETNTCILIDFPPFGKSSEPLQPLNIFDYTLLTNNILNIFSIEKVNIVAHSFGGRVAIELNSYNSKRINKMLLTGCAGIKKKSFTKFFKILKYKFLKCLCKLKLYKKSKLSKFGSSDYKCLSNTMKITFKNIVNYNQKNKIKNIKCPTLLVWGKFDKETPFYFTKIFKKHIKDCEVICFENCSHFAYLERTNNFLAIMQSFFKN